MSIILRDHKTKIVCTIGPSSRSGGVLKKMIGAGMDVARLNFSHGTLEEHARDIATIRAAAADLQRRVTILADLPGPKIRVGLLASEPLLLKAGESVTLTTGSRAEGSSAIPVTYERLADSVSRGSALYMNDGAIFLKVLSVSGDGVRCKVMIGGALRSHKGINLPGAQIFEEPVSEADLSLVDFGLAQGVEVFCASFVEKKEDILKMKEFGRKAGREVRVVAKIERAQAVDRIDEILAVSDAIMVARGDLGVEIPVEEVPVVQKRLIHKANKQYLPVITATQMLLSMTENIRPTRAESSDVANAILDGTDAVMLSEETAIGSYPAETVRMMARIASVAEHHRRELSRTGRGPAAEPGSPGPPAMSEVIAQSVERAVLEAKPKFVLSPTRTGATARRISRFRVDPWILAFTSSEETAAFLALSYGVTPFVLEAQDEDWHGRVLAFLTAQGLARRGDTAVLTMRQFSPEHRTTDSMALITVP